MVKANCWFDFKHSSLVLSGNLVQYPLFIEFSAVGDRFSCPGIGELYIKALCHTYFQHVKGSIHQALKVLRAAGSDSWETSTPFGPSCTPQVLLELMLNKNSQSSSADQAKLRTIIWLYLFHVGTVYIWYKGIHLVHFLLFHIKKIWENGDMGKEDFNV